MRPEEYLHCFKCYAKPSPKIKFFLMGVCKEAACSACMNSAKDTVDKVNKTISCPSCKKTTKFLEIGPNMPEEVKRLFVPVKDIIAKAQKDMERVFKWQLQQQQIHMKIAESKKSVAEKVFQSFKVESEKRKAAFAKLQECNIAFKNQKILLEKTRKELENAKMEIEQLKNSYVCTEEFREGSIGALSDMMENLVTQPTRTQSRNDFLNFNSINEEEGGKTEFAFSDFNSSGSQVSASNDFFTSRGQDKNMVTPSCRKLPPRRDTPAMLGLTGNSAKSTSSVFGGRGRIHATPPAKTHISGNLYATLMQSPIARSDSPSHSRPHNSKERDAKNVGERYAREKSSGSRSHSREHARSKSRDSNSAAGFFENLLD